MFYCASTELHHFQSSSWLERALSLALHACSVFSHLSRCFSPALVGVLTHICGSSKYCGRTEVSSKHLFCKPSPSSLLFLATWSLPGPSASLFDPCTLCHECLTVCLTSSVLSDVPVASINYDQEYPNTYI